MLSPGRCDKPAERGVEGRVVGLGDGRGNDDELRRASRFLSSRAEARSDFRFDSVESLT